MDPADPGISAAKGFVQEVVNCRQGEADPDPHRGQRGVAREGSPREARRAQRRGHVESALRHIQILEGLELSGDEISLKASDPLMMIEAYRMLADKVDYAFPRGVTEAGTPGVRHDQVGDRPGALLSEGSATRSASRSRGSHRGGRVGIDILKSRAPEGRTDICALPVVRARRRSTS